MKNVFILPLLLFAPTLAGAAPDLYGESCPVILTVQSQDCTVTQIHHCEGDPLGANTSVTYDADGYLATDVTDAEGGWVEIFSSWNQSLERSLPNPADPVSLKTLLADGVDTYDFRMSHAEGGVTRMLRVIGADLLTGREVTIDGVVLQEVSNDVRILEEDGGINYQTRGTQYVWLDQRLWLLGLDGVVQSDGSIANYDSRPVTFSMPGDPGIAATVPKYGCTSAPGK